MPTKPKSDNPWDELQGDPVGEHDWLIADIKKGNFNNGKGFTELKGVLTSAGNLPVGLTVGDDTPSDEDTKAEGLRRKQTGKGDWEDSLFQAVVSTKSRLWELEHLYKKKFEDVQVNDAFRVKTVRNKKGYIVIVAFLPKTASTENTGAKVSGVPF